MHTLRFPNSDIRAKVFVRKICFKLRVMILNRIELFYALVVTIDSESRRCLRRWLFTTRPLVGAAGLGLATCKGRPPAGTTGYSQPSRASRQQPTCKGLPPAASPAASRGGGAGRKVGCPLAGRLPTAKGSRRLHRGSSGAVRVKEG
ncbi:hypothetical protein GW17_00062025 [Ensete ventricosum]|nr:hypothetical protein GW17_00062025 [Ensete ventricosum]RZS20100.1 hypothetical protein BHM03_00052578 [Ensete ventricosum]